jgi:hypothetical protein
MLKAEMLKSGDKGLRAGDRGLLTKEPQNHRSEGGTEYRIQRKNQAGLMAGLTCRPA